MLLFVFFYTVFIINRYDFFHSLCFQSFLWRQLPDGEQSREETWFNAPECTVLRKLLDFELMGIDAPPPKKDKISLLYVVLHSVLIKRKKVAIVLVLIVEDGKLHYFIVTFTNNRIYTVY